ncbi:Filamin-A [Armadillidium vulgare]|nr:Filamin-A [Armadillidium vulgare]
MKIIFKLFLSLITPEELVNPNCDELSTMTYLSQYPNAKLKPNAPLRPRTNPGRVRCYGPGVEPSGPVVGAPTHFTIETFSAGKGKVESYLQGPDGKIEMVLKVFGHLKSSMCFSFILQTNTQVVMNRTQYSFDSCCRAIVWFSRNAR